ncbi:MAG: DUF362 domain-containing protein [Planctomycetaceae bacterium]|nr:DUF362 domain-containing protein [Planctomycetaceae bacterium]
MNPVEKLLAGVTIPPMALVEQSFPAVTLPDHRAFLLARLEETVPPGAVTPGMRVAVTAGSRGIADIAGITGIVVDFLKGRGAEPFLVTAMGSHGGATAQGQLDVLAGIGITEASAGAPIRPGTASRLLATLDGGVPVWFDEEALSADAVVVINRVKPHTGFRGVYESGLAKMLAVGLGNPDGADYIHSRGEGEMSGRIAAIAAAILGRVNVLLGVAVLENSEHAVGEIHVMPGRDILDREPALLARARTMIRRFTLPTSTSSSSTGWGRISRAAAWTRTSSAASPPPASNRPRARNVSPSSTSPTPPTGPLSASETATSSPVASTTKSTSPPPTRTASSPAPRAW